MPVKDTKKAESYTGGYRKTINPAQNSDRNRNRYFSTVLEDYVTLFQQNAFYKVGERTNFGLEVFWLHEKSVVREMLNN